MSERQILGERTHEYAAPLDVIYAAITEHLGGWIRLRPGEIQPEVLTAVPYSVVWSTMWPVSPGDTIEIDLSGGSHTSLTFRWLSSTPPDARGIGITRQRLNTTFGADIRGWLAADSAWRTGGTR